MLNINNTCTFSGNAAAEPGYGAANPSSWPGFHGADSSPSLHSQWNPPSTWLHPSLKMRRVKTKQSGFSAFAPCLVGVRWCSYFILKKARFRNGTYFLLPGSSAGLHGTFNPCFISSKLAAHAAGLNMQKINKISPKPWICFVFPTVTQLS